MTVQPETPRFAGPPPKTLDAVVHAITAYAPPDLVAEFEVALGRAWAAARADTSLQPLTQFVETWWTWAVQFTLDPVAACALYARVQSYQTEGPPSESSRVSREQIRERYGV